MRLRPRQRMVIHSGWLVRVLAGSRRWHHCRDCGGRMFVRSASGCCPRCFTRRRDRHERIEQIVQCQVDAELH